MSEAIERIRVATYDRRDEILAFLRSLIGAGKSGEAAIQTLFAKRATALGCSSENIVYNPADVPMVEEFAGAAAIDPAPRTGVVARFKGAGGGRSLILFAHPDGEKIEGTEKWKHDPFAGTIENGRLYGWGVADDLSGVAAGLEALGLVLAAGFLPKGDIVFASTPSKRHARSVSHLLHSGIRADAAVYLHPAESGVGMAEIKAFTSGQVEFRIVVTGEQPPTTEPLQTAFAHQGVNAIDKAFIIWQALKNMDARRSKVVKHPALDKAVGRSTNLMISYIAAGDPRRLSRIAHTCELGAALAFPPPETLSQVCRTVEATVMEAAKGDEWLRENPPQIIWDSGVTGAEVSADHALVQAAFSAVSAISGTKPRINPMHTGSDIRNPIVQKAIPTIGLGPFCGDLTQNGGVDEWVDANDHVLFVGAVAGIIAEWCGVADRR